MAGQPRREHDRLEITDVAELRAWLTEHQATAAGVWLVTWKRSADPRRHVAYDAVVRECLCVGWVDSQARGVDAERTSLLLTPRRPGSGWARTNKQRVAELTAAGLMQPRGLAVVEEAQAPRHPGAAGRRDHRTGHPWAPLALLTRLDRLGPTQGSLR